MIIDSDVLIWYLRGNPKARARLQAIPSAHREVSCLTLLELYSGARNQAELKEIQSLFVNHFSEIHFISEEISALAVELVLRYSIKVGLRPGDALIAATALINQTPLLTANHKHFQSVRGLEVMAFRS